MAGVSLVTLLPFYRYPLKERGWTQKRGPKHGDSFRGPSSTSRHREIVRAVAVDLRRVTEQQQAKSSSLWAKLCVPQNLPPPAYAYSSNLILAGEVKTRESIVTRLEAWTERKLESLFASLFSDLSDQTGSTVRTRRLPDASMSRQLRSRFSMLSFVPLSCGPVRRIRTLDVNVRKVGGSSRTIALLSAVVIDDSVSMASTLIPKLT